MTRVILARHGETRFNLQHRMQGLCDSPLTAAGEAGARELGHRLREAGLSIDSAFYADTGRHRRTAELALQSFPGLVAIETPALRECDFGGFEGMMLSDAVAELPLIAPGWSPGPLPGDADFDMLDLLERIADATAREEYPVEPPSSAAQRAHALLDGIHRQYPGSTSLAISSGITVLALLRRLQMSAPWQQRGIPNCASIELVRSRNGWQLERRGCSQGVPRVRRATRTRPGRSPLWSSSRPSPADRSAVRRDRA